jgi:hypothetical protein
VFRCNFKILLISIIGMPFIALAQGDELCDHLASFASKTKVGETLQVKLINDWANLSKTCEHNNTAAGKEFCDYLVKNTSTEFMNINLSRLLSCSAGGFSFGTININKITGELSLYEIPKLNQDISLDINFSVGGDIIKDFIEIKAENELVE